MIDLFSFLFVMLNGLSSEVLTLITVIVCFASIIGLFCFFGKAGLVAYIVLGALVSNIQVLKTASLSFSAEPMVLGTVIFTSLFWAMEVLTEYEGPHKAQRILYLSFWMPLLVLVWMVLTIATPPALSPDNIEVQHALEKLFLPAPALFCASLAAYFFSQWSDIWIFTSLKKIFQGKWLGVRAIVTALISGFVDNALFSLLAWKVFCIQNISFDQLFWTYIMGAYVLRAILSFGAAPLLHLIKYVHQKGWILTHPLTERKLSSHDA